METLSKVLIVSLVICLVVIGFYGGFTFYINHLISSADDKCKMDLCNVGVGEIDDYHYSPYTGICHCFKGREVESYYELPIR